MGTQGIGFASTSCCHSSILAFKDGGLKADIANRHGYSGERLNVRRRYDQWPQSCASGCPFKSASLYLSAGSKLTFDKPQAASPAFDEYVSDPAKPVTYRPRPIRPTYAADSTWRRWLVDDQRFASDRTDVLTYTSEVLKAPLRIAGQPVAHLFASTSGTDGDWVVKLIDVYPDEVPAWSTLGSYRY